MTHEEIQDVLFPLLEAAGLGVPIVYPNKKGTSDAKPRIDIVFFGGETDDPRLKPVEAHEQISGGYNFIVVDDKETGAQNAGRLAQQIKALYPFGMRLPIASGGSVIIAIPTTIRLGFPDEGLWKTPVVLNYRSET